jgi:hypothetical protein
MKMEPIEGSETSVIRTKTPGNYPKENILQKSRILEAFSATSVTNNSKNDKTFVSKKYGTHFSAS